MVKSLLLATMAGVISVAVMVNAAMHSCMQQRIMNCSHLFQLFQFIMSRLAKMLPIQWKVSISGQAMQSRKQEPHKGVNQLPKLLKKLLQVCSMAICLLQTTLLTPFEVMFSAPVNAELLSS